MFKKYNSKMISDAICGILILVSILTYILIGVFTRTWHPTWVIILITMVFCSVVTIIVNTFNKVKNNKTDKNKE